jgi:hypothetical protein
MMGKFTVKNQSKVLDMVRPWGDLQSGDHVRSSFREYNGLGFCGIHLNFPSGEILVEGEDSYIESVGNGVQSPGLNKEKTKEKGRGGPRTRLSCVVAAQLCHLRVQLVTRNMRVGYLNDGTRH